MTNTEPVRMPKSTWIYILLLLITLGILATKNLVFPNVTQWFLPTTEVQNINLPEENIEGGPWEDREQFTLQEINLQLSEFGDVTQEIKITRGETTLSLLYQDPEQGYTDPSFDHLTSMRINFAFQECIQIRRINENDQILRPFPGGIVGLGDKWVQTGTLEGGEGLEKVTDIFRVNAFNTYLWGDRTKRDTYLLRLCSESEDEKPIKIMLRLVPQGF